LEVEQKCILADYQGFAIMVRAEIIQTQMRWMWGEWWRRIEG
jgi:hypothetical protein